MKHVLTLGVFLATLSLQTFAQSGVPFNVEQTGSQSWRITVSNAAPFVAAFDRDSIASIVQMSGHVPHTAPGAATMPLKRFWFPVPSGSALSVRVVSLAERSQPENLNLSPVMPTGVAPKDISLRGSKGYLALGSVHPIDGIRKQALDLVSAKYDAESGILHWIETMVLEVTVTGTSGAAPAPMDQEEIDQKVAAYNLTTDAYLNWFVPGSQMLKIITVAEGVYRVTYQDAVAAGAPVSAMAPATLKLYLDGEERAIMVTGDADGTFDDGDYIEFYAPRRAGIMGDYYDEWSDDNVFWLAWGGNPGKRSQPEQADPATGTGINSIPVMRHFEEDRMYHLGDSDEFDGSFSDRMPGETWIWKYIQRDSIYNVDVNLPDFSAAPAYIVSSMKKSSSHGSRMRLSVNGTVIKEFDVDNWYHGAALPMKDTALIDASILRKGLNTVTYHSIGKNPEGQFIIERVYLDAFDVYYRSDGSTADATYVLQNQAYTLGQPVPGRMRVTLTGFPGSQLRGINKSTGDTLTGTEISQAGNTSAVSFSVPSSDDYFIYSQSSILSPTGIAPVTMTDYGTGSHGADYIVVTHSEFMPAAQRLANYRQSSDGYRTFIAKVEDLYNEFNFGHKHPSAIRRFIMKAYGTWAEPKPEFLTLLGDASWDPKQIQSNAVKVDYVPAFGNPVSDTYFITADTIDVYPLIHVGRIPCETNSAAEAVIDKIIAYEAAPPADWHNRFLLTGGGITESEFPMFYLINEGFISKYFRPNCLEFPRIYKSNPSLVGYEDIDSIITKVNDGVLWMNFVGHGGSRIIDIGIERPDIFDVQGKYFIFCALSCNTAHFAEQHETGLNERFMMAEGNGSIGALGSSGLGFLSRDEILGNGMFKAIGDGEARTFGEVLTLGKISLIDASNPVSDWIVRNTAMQFTYLGDPATKLPLEKMPELAIRTQDVATNPEIMVQGTQVVFTTEFQNFGFCMDDTVTARVRLLSNGQEFYHHQKLIPPFAEAYTETWNVSLGPISGAIEIEVEIDTENLLVERTKVNNKITVNRNVLRRGVTPVFPNDNAVISLSDPVLRFVVANPAIVPLDEDDVTIELQIAMNLEFTSPVVTRTGEIGTVFTWFEDIGSVFTEGVYYWRGRMAVDGVPEEWSPVWSFTARQTASGSEFVQTQKAQLAKATAVNVEQDETGAFKLGTRDIHLEVFSAGNNQAEIKDLAQIYYNGVDLSPNVRGFNIVVIDPAKGSVIEKAAFDTYLGVDTVRRMIDFMRRIPDNYYIALAIRDDANGWFGMDSTYTTLIPEIRDELRQYGCTLFDQGYPYVWFHTSYAMFGRRSEPERTRQAVNSFGAAFFKDTITVQSFQGSVRSMVAGPANSWDEFSWEGSLPAQGSTVDLKVLSGISQKDSVLIELQDVKPGNHVPLAGLGSAHPFLYFQLTLNDTTTVASPVVKGWSATFTSVFPELGINNQVVESDPDSVLEGRSITLTVQVYNAGKTEATNVPVYIRTPMSESQGATPVIIPSIPAGKDEYEEFTYEIPTAGLRGNWNADISVAPGNERPEYYKGNNLFSERFSSSKDDIRPDLRVWFDGAPIVDLDYVSPTPVIEIALTDNSPLPVTDTSSMQIFLDGRRIWLNNNPELTYTLGGAGEEKFTVMFRPDLRPGIRTLSVTGKDAGGIASDSIPYQVRVQVRLDNAVDQVYPVPNPSPGPMHFTFRILGATAPESGSIKIYTIAGRLVREIEIMKSDVRIGFNRIPWDGRDQDGDLLANGVYLYKLALYRDGTNQESIGKVAILR